jgi:hypothetical protein
MGFAKSREPFSLGSLVGRPLVVTNGPVRLIFSARLLLNGHECYIIFAGVLEYFNWSPSAICKFVLDETLVSIGPAARSVLAVTLLLVDFSCYLSLAKI